MKVKYQLVYDRKQQASKKGRGLVQIQAYLNGERRYFSTKLHLTLKEWDRSKNVPKDPYTARLLRNQIEELETFEIEYRALHKQFSLQDFDFYLESKKPSKKREILTFTEFFRDQLTKQPQLAKATLVTHRVTFKTLCAFRKKVEFSDLNFAFLQEFNNFVSKRGKGINTIEKYHRHLRKYINLAILHDFLPEDRNPYKKFKLVTEETEVIFLLPEERKRIEALEFTPEQKELELARDMFLFACYTGLRHSDCSKICAENLLITADGIALKYKAQKTSKLDYKPLSLLFDGAPAEIIKKHLPLRPDVQIFRGMYSQKVNKLLKKIARMAYVNPKLYFKASRDTFGTNLYMLSGDDKLVQVQLQHSKRDQTDKYVHAVQQVQNEALKKIFKQTSKGSDDSGNK
ncbi:integrase [Runella defluvii]|uniref:Integrase n=1 Tax=Runella defluvii TaxID=370973 RepID=A0A7W5ZIV0_9BACT|nr:site-specific integrase [Runella defluvii]MBB3837638.1 integrase [Runella defluvii]